MVEFDPKIHHRRSIRLAGYDYAQAGAYYVTIVTWQREFLFGGIVNGEMRLNRHGKIAEECWQLIPKHFPDVELGAYVIMPNQVHGIIMINDTDKNRVATNSQPVGASHDTPLRPRGVSSGSLGAIIGSFKSAVTKRIGRELNETGIWQRSFYEHIIRNDKEFANIQAYVINNPVLWDEDEENPDM